MHAHQSGRAPVVFLREPELCRRRGESRSTLRRRIAEGLFTEGVRLGANRVAWPEHEADAIARAQMAGRTDAELRELVARLVAERQQAAQ